MSDRHLQPEPLHDYVDGTLDAAEAAAVETHLLQCEHCRTEVARFRSLKARTQAIPRSITPPRDLWPAIDARLEPGRRRNRPMWSSRYGLAAAAVLLVVLSAAVTSWLVRNTSGPESAAVARPLLTQFLVTETEYRDAVAALQDELEEGKMRLTPETLALIERNLRIIDAAIRETRAALLADPENREVLEMLSRVYRAKLDVLLQANRFVSFEG